MSSISLNGNGSHEANGNPPANTSAEGTSTDKRIAEILLQLADRRDVVFQEHLTACLEQVARDHHAAMVEIGTLLSQQARATFLAMIEKSFENAFPLLTNGVGVAASSGPVPDDLAIERPTNGLQMPPELEEPPSKSTEAIADMEPSQREDSKTDLNALDEEALPTTLAAVQSSPNPEAVVALASPLAQTVLDPTLPADVRELFEGTVRLKVEADGCVRQMVHFMDELRHKPQLRLLQMVGERQQAVGVWIGLREPLPLKEVLLGMECVSQVGILAASPGSEGRELTVHLQEDSTSEEMHLASVAKA